MTENIAQTTERLCGRIRMLEEQLEELGQGKLEKLTLEVDELKEDRRMLSAFLDAITPFAKVHIPHEILLIIKKGMKANG